jgi:hypothetical protein
MRFGLYLLNRILGDAEPRNLWNTIRERRANAGRPLRLELILPANDASAVEDIPFELLAEQDDFLFRRHGASVVRVIEDMPRRPLSIEPGQAILAAWANPNVLRHCNR